MRNATSCALLLLIVGGGPLAAQVDNARAEEALTEFKGFWNITRSVWSHLRKQSLCDGGG